MASKGFRYPTIREMYMFRPANPDLKPERLWSYELSFAQRLLDGRLSYGVNVFYIDGENLIMRMPIDGRPLNVNTGKIENSGVEAQVAYRIVPAWSVDANYSYLHMDNPVLASPEHKLYVGTAFQRDVGMCQPDCNMWPGCIKNLIRRKPRISCYGMYAGLSVFWMGLMFG